MTPYYQDSAVTIYHGDCREIVPALGRFDLLLTDPPYGIGENQKKQATRGGRVGFKSKGRRGGSFVPATDYGENDWDQPVELKDLQAAIAVAKKAIIWGGNYYPLPPCKGPLVWDKEQSGDFADGEMAWNNLGTALRIKRHLWNGMLRKDQEPRFHPTQKPLDVIAWCIQLAGADAETILDPYAGSGTTGRAAKDLGRKAVLIELEERYCEIAAARMSQEVMAL